jgi:phosphopantetheinyl transferase
MAFAAEGKETGILSAEESSRAEALQVPAARGRFIAGRWLARTMLSRLTGLPAASIAISVSSNGRPALAGGSSLDFNISHSGDIAVCAVADVPVGVDVERVTSKRNLLGVARECFQSQEVEDVAARLAANGPANAAERFTAYWALKEAHMKRLGKGVWNMKDSPPFPLATNAGAPRVDSVAWYCLGLSSRGAPQLPYVLAVSAGKGPAEKPSWAELHLEFLLAEDPLPWLLFRSPNAGPPEGRG